MANIQNTIKQFAEIGKLISTKLNFIKLNDTPSDFENGSYLKSNHNSIQYVNHNTLSENITYTAVNNNYIELDIDFETKYLSGSHKSNSVVSDLSFNNLVPGNTYRLSSTLSLVQTAMSNPNISFYHNGLKITEIFSNFANSTSKSTSLLFNATSTDLTISGSNLDFDHYIGGSTDNYTSFVQLELVSLKANAFPPFSFTPTPTTTVTPTITPTITPTVTPTVTHSMTPMPTMIPECATSPVTITVESEYDSETSTTTFKYITSDSNGNGGLFGCIDILRGDTLTIFVTGDQPNLESHPLKITHYNELGQAMEPLSGVVKTDLTEGPYEDYTYSLTWVVPCDETVDKYQYQCENHAGMRGTINVFGACSPTTSDPTPTPTVTPTLSITPTPSVSAATTGEYFDRFNSNEEMFLPIILE